MSYDAAGNLTNDGLHSYAFDAENKIVKLDNVQAYVYDGEGKRVRKLVGENTRFVYGIGGELLAEYNGASGAIQKEYVYGASGLTATIEPTTGTQYITADRLGSPRVVTNASGSVTLRRDFMPFGEEIATGIGGRNILQGYGASNSIRQQFATYERDSESGLDFAEARYYNSNHGRFTSADPLDSSAKYSDPQTWNRYNYCLNNPLTLIDPTGLVPSTHTDKDGRVLEVIDDGDLSVYRHNDIDASSGKQEIVTVNDSQPLVEKMGETEYWDEFRRHDEKTGAILPEVAQDTRIRFGTSFDMTLNTKINEASNMSLSERAKELKPGGKFDIKNDRKSFDSQNEGRLLNGKYATARSAGNYLAGYLGATGTEYGIYISEKTFMKLAGALHQGQYSTTNVAKILTYGKAYGSAPYYGEIEYAGRRISAGFNAGIRHLDKLNVVNRPRY